MASEDIGSYDDCGVELHPMMNAAPDENPPTLPEDLQQLLDLKLTQDILSGGNSSSPDLKIQENDEKVESNTEDPSSQSDNEVNDLINHKADQKKEIEDEYVEEKGKEVLLENPVENVEVSISEKPVDQAVTNLINQEAVEKVQNEPNTIAEETEDDKQDLNTKQIPEQQPESDVKLENEKTKTRVNELSVSKMETRRKISRRVRVLLEAKTKEEKTIVEKTDQEEIKESNFAEEDQSKNAEVPPREEEAQHKQVDTQFIETKDEAMEVEDRCTIEPEKSVRPVRSRTSRKLVLSPEPPKTQPERRTSKRSREPDGEPSDNPIQPVKKAPLTARSASSRSTISTSAPSTRPDHPTEAPPFSADGSQIYRCIPCKYSTTRLNNIVLHDKQYCKYKQQLVKDMSMAEAQKYHQQKHQQKHQRSNNKRSSR